MAIRRNNFGLSLERYEIAKLVKKYTELGYEVFNLRNFYSRNLGPDLYIKNNETKDEIVFEIKSHYTYRANTLEQLNIRRDYYRQEFPNARFVLVLAKEEQPITFESETIKTLLLNFIKSNYAEEFNEIFVKNNVEFEEVDYFECTNVDLGDFTTIKFEGQANIKFWIEVDEETFKGKRLTDGIPFHFNLKIEYKPNKTSLYQIDRQSSKIKFDFS